MEETFAILAKLALACEQLASNPAKRLKLDLRYSMILQIVFQILTMVLRCVLLLNLCLLGNIG